MTRRVGWLVIVATVTVTAAWAAEADFSSLFDGKTLNGWVPEHTDRFSIRDGAIFDDGGTGWLRSAQVFKDFEFQAEYRALKKGADSGVFFRAAAQSTSQPPYWPVKGYQLQIIDADSNLQIFGHGTPPPRYDRKTEVLRSVMKGPGEWQKLTLKVVGKHAEVTLNDKRVTISDAINLNEGCIGLQGEQGQFEWRALRVRRLSPP